MVRSKLAHLGRHAVVVMVFGAVGLLRCASAQVVYVTTSSGISGFTVNPNTGSMTAISGSPFGTAFGGLTNVAIHPSGAFVYATQISTLDVYAFAVNPNSGALAPVPGSPFQGGILTGGVAVDPAGR